MKTNSGRLTLARSKRMDASLKSKIQIETNGDAIPVNVAGPGSNPGSAHAPEPLICDCDVPIFLEPVGPNSGDTD
jgi:hypothetical protein